MPQDKYMKEARIAELAKERARRSPEQQLQILDQRLGVGIGAKKERDRLQKMIDSKSQKS